MPRGHDRSADQGASGPSPAHRRVLLAVEVVLLVVAVVLRFIHLDADVPLQQNTDDIGDEGYWFVPARDLVRLGGFDADSNFVQAQAGAPLTTLTLAALGHALGRFDLVLVRGPSAFYSSLLLLLGFFYFDRLRRMPLAGVCFLGLYGLLPLTLFYGRIAHLEPHVLFWLFAAFVLIERARTWRGLASAGAAASIAVTIKSVAVLVLPALAIAAVVRHRRRAALAALVAGGAPLALAYTAHLLINAERFAPTLAAVASYHARTGFFVDRFSVEYFWLAPLVWPYLPWIAAGAVLHLVVRQADPARAWMLTWLATVLLALSLRRYQSYARHMLVLFPMLLLTALAVGRLHARVRGAPAVALSAVCTLALALTAAGTTAAIGAPVFASPRYSQRDAARTLAAITDERDRVVGVHAHALAVEARYRPKMSLTSRHWGGVDPLVKVDPTVALIATRFNGRPRSGTWDRIFPRRSQFRFAEPLERVRYLDGRFEVDVYRVFRDAAERRTFLRLRQGRRSRYDGVLYNLFRDDLATGCLVKGALVAESRGEPEISHRQISATGCAGMMGFCYATAAEPRFADVFQRLVRRVRSPASEEMFAADDRFVPEKALRAGARYLGDLRGRFASYSDDVRLAFAAYNAGQGLIAYLIDRSGKPDPRWDADLLPILAGLGSETIPGYATWARAARDHKFRVETPLYVGDAARTFEACMSGTSFTVPDAAETASGPPPVP